MMVGGPVVVDGPAPVGDIAQVVQEELAQGVTRGEEELKEAPVPNPKISPSAISRSAPSMELWDCFVTIKDIAQSRFLPRTFVDICSG